MSVKLLAEHHLEFLSIKGGCTGSSESTLVKMPHCWKSRVTAQLVLDTRRSTCCKAIVTMLLSVWDLRPFLIVKA